MKRYRIMKIKEIIQSQIIETQEELANALKKEGIVVTQATVSRDQGPDASQDSVWGWALSVCSPE